MLPSAASCAAGIETIPNDGSLTNPNVVGAHSRLGSANRRFFCTPGDVAAVSSDRLQNESSTKMIHYMKLSDLPRFIKFSPGLLFSVVTRLHCLVTKWSVSQLGPVKRSACNETAAAVARVQCEDMVRERDPKLKIKRKIKSLPQN